MKMLHIIKISLILSILLFTQTFVLAQQTGTIEGEISAEEAESLAGVNVYLDGTKLGAATNTDGRFIIPNVPAGSYTLVVSGIKFKTVKQTVGVKANETTTLSFALEPGIIALEEVVVIGRRDKFEKAYEQAQSVSVVTRKSVEDYNSANNFDALRLVPGVSYLWSSGNRNGKPAKIRGGASWTIPDVIDGYPSIREAGIGVEDGGLTADLGSSIPAIALQSIDIKKGSAGVLYLGNAAGGVIVNKIKTGSAGAPKGSVWLEANPISETLIMADVGGGSGNFDYYVATKVLDGDYQDFKDERGRVQDNDKFYSVLTKLGYRPSAKSRLELFSLSSRDQTEYTLARRDNRATPNLDESLLIPNNYKSTTGTDYFGLRLDNNISEKFTTEVGYSLFLNTAIRRIMQDDIIYNADSTVANITNQRIFVDQRNRPEVAHTFFGNGYFETKLSDNLEYYNKFGFESVAHNQKENARNSDKEQNFLDQSVFFANTITYKKTLFLNLGGRFLRAADDWKDSQTGFYYDVGVAVKLAQTNTKLRAAFSTSYSRNKGFAYFFGPIDDANGVELTDNRSLEFGIEQTIQTQSVNGNFNATYFRSDYDNAPNFSGWGARTVFYDDRDVKGVELSTNLTFNRTLSVLGSFTYLQNEITANTNPDRHNLGSSGDPLPKYAAAFGFEFKATDRFSLNLIGMYDDGMRRVNVNDENGETSITRNAPHTRVNLSTFYQVTNSLALRFRVENLLDEKDLGFSSEIIGVDGSITNNETVALDPGRFITAGFVFGF